MINQVTLVGRLGKDPEIESVGQNGHKKMRLSIATDNSFKDKDGVWHNDTDWHNITIWNKMAEYVLKFAKKGAVVCVTGMLQTRVWEKDAKKFYDYHVKPDSVKVLTPEKVEGGRGPQEPPADGQRSRSQMEDDLPF